MKIIQHGKKIEFSTVKRFKCENCGCVFEAEKDEYKSGSQYNEAFFQCVCPDCGKTANEDRLRKSNAGW